MVMRAGVASPLETHDRLLQAEAMRYLERGDVFGVESNVNCIPLISGAQWARTRL